jgi:hypothetical protein
MNITHEWYNYSVESKAKISYAISGNKYLIFEKTSEKNPASKKNKYLYDLMIKRFI